MLEAPVESTLAHEHAFRGLMHEVGSGRAQSPRDLLVMQAQVYRYSHHVDVTTRVVDRAAGSLKQLLGTQF